MEDINEKKNLSTPENEKSALLETSFSIVIDCFYALLYVSL